jgi:hypothetical protein
MSNDAFDTEVYAFIRGDDGLSFLSVVECLLVLARARSAGDPLRVLVMMNQREARKAVSDSLGRLGAAGLAEERSEKWFALLPKESPKPVQKGLF